MNAYSKYMVGCVVLLWSAAAFADGDKVTTGKVALLQAASFGPIRFQLEGTPSLCTLTPASGAGTQVYGDIQIDGTTTTADGVRAMLSLLAAAKLAGRPVTIHAERGATSNILGCRVVAVDIP